MKTISATFTRAASGNTIKTSAGISILWLMMTALAILDDGERCTKERRRETEAARPQPRSPVPTP